MPGVGPESTYTHGDSYNTSGEWAGVRHNNGECGSCEDRHWECIPPEVPAALELAFGQRPESDLISDRAALLDSTIRSYRRILKLVGRSLEVQLCGGETVHVSVPHAMLEMTARLLVE
jgi:hypothetical protein